MTATDLWFLIAAILAGVSVLLHLIATPPTARWARGALAAAVGSIAVAFLTA